MKSIRFCSIKLDINLLNMSSIDIQDFLRGHTQHTNKSAFRFHNYVEHLTLFLVL
jgi:hypothetical protein